MKDAKRIAVFRTSFGMLRSLSECLPSRARQPSAGFCKGVQREAGARAAQAAHQPLTVAAKLAKQGLGDLGQKQGRA